MFKINKEELEVNGKKLTLETGKVARQADGAIIASLGETVVIATVVGAKKLKDEQDYFPLSVNYQESFTLLEKFQEVILKGKQDLPKLKH